MPISEYRTLNNLLQNVLHKAMAWDALAPRATEAYDYCKKYKVGLLGENIWHVVLDDAIRMRKELDAKVESERNFPHSNTDMGS